VRLKKGKRSKGNPSITNLIVITKIGAAEAHIKAAVWLYLQGGHLVPVFTLANAAREVVATLGEKAKLDTIHQQLAARRGIPVKEMVKEVSGPAGFLKHADRNPNGSVEIYEELVAATLHIACHDFYEVTGATTIEAAIFDAWMTAIGVGKVQDAPLRKQPMIRKFSSMDARRQVCGLA
jgi:hypothetical protein